MGAGRERWQRQMSRDCTAGTAKRELERIVHSVLTRFSQTAFAMAAAQPGS